jgi:hypothetical protein
VTRRQFVARAINQLAIAWVLIFGAIFLVTLVTSSSAFGIDARIYVEATRTWLAGGDPWAIQDTGIRFGAPPTSLLAFAPLVWLPNAAVERFVPILGAAALVYAIARTKAGWWWLLSVPALEGVWVGSLDPVAIGLVAALPLTGRASLPASVIGAAGVIARIFAVVPLFVLGHRRALAIALGIVLLSTPFLPWATFFGRLPELARLFADETDGGKGVSRVPWLILPTVVALIAIGRRDGAWLAVPALWPSSQLHYGILALPAASPIFAAFAASPLEAPLALGVIGVAVVRAIEGRLDPWSWVPSRWRLPREP